MTPLVLRTEQDTNTLAGAIARNVTGGESIGLSGTLGAGKTTLVRYLVEALGGNASDVASPSYTLQHEYTGGGGVTVDHWDLYRLSSSPLELLEPPAGNTIRLIEWPERSPELMPDLDLRVTLLVDPDGTRRAVVEGRLATDIAAGFASESKR